MIAYSKIWISVCSEIRNSENQNKRNIPPFPAVFAMGAALPIEFNKRRSNCELGMSQPSG